MSKIPYIEELTVAENMARVRAHLDITNSEISVQVGLSTSTVRRAIELGLKTGAGNQNANTLAMKKKLSCYFTDGIPDLNKKEHLDLFLMMGCESCRYRSRTHKGCFKFGITKENINSGLCTIHTLFHGSFTLTEKKRCPYANTDKEKR